MSKTITIEDDVYDLLASLKEDSRRDSFTRVIRRYLPRPCETAGELLDVYEHAPLPKVNWDVLDRDCRWPGQASGGRKSLRTPPSSFTSLFSRYYREPVISRDNAFDRVRGLRRLAY